MAARDRFGGFGEPAPSQLRRYIFNACDPQNFEPNLALCLEITDMINAKKGNAPREASVTIVHFVNHRNQNAALLALNLLDICVKNCGYPFHLQISTKEFLNELVRRFPERPPVYPSRTQNKILELIEEWRQTICQTSRYKEDLGFIRDMHRLLSYKGYVFPKVNREDAAVLNPSDNLRSAEEMEEEEKDAQSAKLQELIRRGTPQDLQEANKLMKVMAGYDTRNKTDYRAKAAEEVGRVQQKAKLLEEMLQGYKSGDEIKDGDVYEELAIALSNAHPKIQKMCEEESDDHEAVAKLFEINDSIHRTIERYHLIKKGDLEGAAKIPKGTLGTSGAGVTKGPDNELSLIDLGDDDNLQKPMASTNTNNTASAPQQSSAKSALEEDLLGLSLDSSTYGQGGGIALSNSVSSLPPTAEQQSAAKSSIMSAFNQPMGISQTSQTPSSSLFGGMGSPSPAPTSPAPPQSLQQPTSPDPFASLGAPGSSLQSVARQPSPFQFQQSVKSESPQTADLVSLGTTNATAVSSSGTQPSPAPQQQSNGDDDWTFSSALPDQSSELTVLNSTINVVFTSVRQDDGAILITSKISNNVARPISELMFQVAVLKMYQLNLETQSSRSLAASQRHGITQNMRLSGVERGKAGAVKVRWKTSYLIDGSERKEESGEIPSLGIS